MKAISIAILLFIVSIWSADACRFTVREIGFSILSQDIYTLVVIDANANHNDNLWKEFHTKNRDCNLRLEILNPVIDSEHPIVKSALQKGLKFPVIILVAPDSRIFKFEENDISKIYNEILEAELGKKLRMAFPYVFAAVLWVEGENEIKNRLTKTKVKQECAAIENIMPGMPKVVKNGPLEISISKSDFQTEKLLLWSLGIDSIPAEPVAFVLYGRGRIIGDALDYQQIMDGGLYKYMSMIGADCECGLDKKWMLGNQIPMLWDKDSRQSLAKLAGFDVDNPMILAEMSRILATESLGDATGSVAFAPETIDLDAVFGNTEAVKKVSVKQVAESKTEKSLAYTFIFILVVLFGVAGILLFKKRK